MAIRIVTDSCADLPPQLAEEVGVTVLPCYVVVGDVTYRDGVDLSHDEFYDLLRSTPRLPTTAQPSAANFQGVYEELLGQGHQVLSIHVSGKLSGTVNSAHQAKAAIGESAPIEIIDSLLASMPQGLVVLAAAQLAGQGYAYEQLADQVREDLPLTHGIFLIDTLEYLQKGGRIGKAQAFVGSVLSVKPILKLQDGEAHPVERPRNRERAIRRLLELVRELAPVRQLAVMHNTEPERAEDLRQRLSDMLPEDQVLIGRFGPTLGTYLGPKALGVALTQSGGTASSP